MLLSCETMLQVHGACIAARLHVLLARLLPPAIKLCVLVMRAAKYTHTSRMFDRVRTEADFATCAQLAFNRSLISVDERNRVFRVMKSLQLPFWHPVCCTKLFYKVSWRKMAAIWVDVIDDFDTEAVRYLAIMTTLG